MDMQQLVEGARDALTVRRVFGDPYERNGTTLIPVAEVKGGGGGGQGDSPEGKGWGGGGGIAARPVGVFVMAGDEVRWQPAVDINRIIVGGQLVAVVALLTARSIAKARAKRGRRR